MIIGRITKMGLVPAKNDPEWCWKDDGIFVVQSSRESGSKASERGGYHELSRWSGGDCRGCSGGSDDGGFRTRRRGIREAIAFCYDLHLLAKSSEAGADALDDWRYQLAKSALKAS